MSYLDSQRIANADATYGAHHFPADHEPIDAGGWETVPRDGVLREWSRQVLFPNAQAPSDVSLVGRFTVVFEENSAEIIGSYASIDGSDIGASAPVRVFVVDADAAKLPTDNQLLGRHDVESILDGRQLITWFEEDNDREKGTSPLMLQEEDLDEFKRTYVTRRELTMDVSKAAQSGEPILGHQGFR